MDLTVENADQVREFYSVVAGWRAQGLDMGEYDDFLMFPPDADAAVAGICHARGPNAKLPAAWLLYITVPDIEECARRVVAMGGEIIDGPTEMSSFGRTCFIRDPSGAACALFQPAVTAKTRARKKAGKVRKTGAAGSRPRARGE